MALFISYVVFIWVVYEESTFRRGSMPVSSRVLGASSARVEAEPRGKDIYLCMGKQRVLECFEAKVAENRSLGLCLVGVFSVSSDAV